MNNQLGTKITIWVWVGFLCTMMFLSAFPGWISPDYLAMLKSFSPENGGFIDGNYLLSLAWSHLLPLSFAGVGPLLFQMVIFWTAIGLLSIEFSEKRSFLGFLFPTVVFMLDATWTLAWIWQDSFVLAFGLLAFSLLVRGELGNNMRETYTGLFLLGLIGSVRPFAVVPLALVAAFSLRSRIRATAKSGSRFQYEVERGGGWGKKWVAGLALFLIAFVGPMAAGTLDSDGNDGQQRVADTLFFDLIRVECRSANTAHVLAKFSNSWDRNEICANFSPFSAHSVTRGFPEALRLPGSPAEYASISSAWWEVAPRHFLLLAKDRVLLTVRLMRPSDPYIVPSYDLNGGTVDLAPRGRGGEVGMEPIGHGALAISRVPSAIIGIVPGLRDVIQTGLLYVVVLPFLALWNFWQTRRFSKLFVVAILSFPLLWTFSFGLVSPWDTTRYISVAVLWGLSVLFLSLDGGRK